MIKLITLIFILFLSFSVKAETTTISVVIPFSAGGATDQLWRVIEPHLNKRLHSRGIRLITENIPGAGGTIGTNRVAISEKPMLGFFSPAFAISPNTLPENVKYKSSDFKLIGYAGETEMYMISTLKNLKEFQTACKSRKIFYGSSGVGSTSHLLGTMVGESFSCVELVHIPYKGISQSYNDLFAGRLDYVVDYAINTKGLAESGRINEILLVDEKFPIYLESWHMFVSNKSVNDEILAIIKKEFENLKKDKIISTEIENRMKLKNFSMIKNEAWIFYQFEIYRKFISKLNLN